MRKLILATAAATALIAATALSASAAPVGHVAGAPDRALVTKADWDGGGYHHWHHHWHHRHWEHHHWRYW